MGKEIHKGVVIISGGTKGIGQSLVEHFLESGFFVITTGSNKENLKKLKDQNKDESLKYYHLDFLSKISVQNFIEEIKKYERVDILINNAGINKIDFIDEISEKDWDSINMVNLKGPFLLTRVISKKMKKYKFGKIINIASIFSIQSRAKRASYSSSKWGLIGLTKAIALDLAPYNILVNAVSPGFVDTELTRKILSSKEIKDLSKTIPQKRLAEPNEIAEVVFFLSSRKNTYITGQNIVIDGGYTSA